MGRYSKDASQPEYVQEKSLQHETGIVRELMKLDLNSNEAKMLFYLMVYNNSTASEISRLSGIPRTEAYHYLGILVAKGAVRTTFDRPQRYRASSYREIVEHFVSMKTTSLDSVVKNMEYYDRIIGEMQRAGGGSESDDTYQIIVGEGALLAKMKKMVNDARKNIVLLITESELALFHRSSIFNEFQQCVSNGVTVRILTSSGKIADSVRDDAGPGVFVRLLDKPAVVSWMIVDNGMIAFVDDDRHRFNRQHSRFMYTNNKKLMSILANSIASIQEIQ